MTSRSVNVVFTAFALCLAGCASASGSGGKPLPLLTFDNLKPITINVGALKSHSDQEMAAESFVVSPYAGLERYLHSRFTPTGFHGTLEATIQDASVAHSYEPSANTVGRYLDVAGHDVYDMHLGVRLQDLDDDGRVIYGTKLNAERIIKVDEHASIAEREKRQFEAMEEMFRDLDTEIIRVVLQEMQLGATLKQ